MNTINYKKWAFHFTIWIVIVNVVIFWVTVNYNSLVYDPQSVQQTIWKLGLLTNLLLIGTILFLVISTVKKEKKNYQYWIAMVVAILLIISFLLNFFNVF